MRKRTGLIVARKKAGLTQEQVAAHLGITRAAYTRYETGLRTPLLHIALTLERLLKTDLSLLFGDAAEKSLDPTGTEGSPRA